MRTSLLLVIALSFFAAVQSVGRTRKVKGTLVQSARPKPFNEIVNLNLDEICYGYVTGDFNNWFNGWIVRNLLTYTYTRPTAIAHAQQGQVSGHIKNIDTYVNEFAQRAKDLKKYSRLYFDVQIKDLVSRTNEILGVPEENPFDDAAIAPKLESEVGPYAQEIIDKVASTEHSIDDVGSIGQIFKDEDLSPSKGEDLDLEKVIELNKEPIRAALRNIIKIAANKLDGDRKWDHLSTVEKGKLQRFFDKLKYLLPERKDEILKLLTGEPASKAVHSHPFVGKELLTDLRGLPTEYKGVFNRDLFIVDFDDEHTLEELNKASEPKYFSWDFFDAFAGIPYSRIADKVDKKPEAKKDRKIARLHHMLYKVYTFARDDNTLPPNAHLGTEETLIKLMDWIINTDLFDKTPLELPEAQDDEEDESPVNSQNELPELQFSPSKGVDNKGQKQQALFNPIKFRRYFVPLLHLICSKITGCSLLGPKKDAVVDKFIKYNNVEELKQKQNVAQLLPKNVLDALTEAAAVTEMDKFGDDLTGMLDEIPKPNVRDSVIEEDDNDDDFEQNAEDDSTPNLITFRPKLIKPDYKEEKLPADEEEDTPKKVTPAKLKAKINELQDNFDKTIGDRYFPAKGEETDPQKIAQVQKLIEKIESTDDLDKKNNLRTFSVKYVLKKTSAAKPEDPKLPNPMLKIVGMFANPQIVALRQKINYNLVAGFRNFLFRTMNAVGPYKPEFGDEEFTYELDVAFFLVFNSVDRVTQLKNTVGAGSPEYKQQLLRSKEDMDVVKKSFIEADKSLQVQRTRITNQNTLSQEPLFLERAYGIEFFYNFIDFYEYYENIKQDAKAVNVDYYRVYLQFYQILSHFRRGNLKIIENPHEYVLRKIEYCMTVAEAQQGWSNLGKMKQNCLFSYRKYAEVLSFYKIYLLATKKNVKQELQLSTKGEQFNVHTRMFLVFSNSNAQYGQLLDLNCKAFPTEPICVSWKVYSDILSFIRSNGALYSEFARKIEQLPNLNKPETKINIFNGLEAAYLFNKRSDMINWSVVSELFSTDNQLAVAQGKATGFAKILKFEEADTDVLTTYLIRTYKKLDVSVTEENLATAIYGIMEGEEESSDKDDSLTTFLLYNNRIVPFYIKLFLQYSVKDEHFKRIAQLLIKNNINSDLIAINDIDKDAFFLSFAKETAKMTQHEAIHHIKDKLKAEYAKIYKECVAVARQSVSRVIEEDPVFDPFADLEEIESQVEEIVEKEDKAAEKVVEKVIVITDKFTTSDKTDLAALKEKLGQQIIHSYFDPQNSDQQITVEKVSMEIDEEFDEDEEEFDEEEEDEEQVTISGVLVDPNHKDFVLKSASEIADVISKRMLEQLNQIMESENVHEISNLPAEALMKVSLPPPKYAQTVKDKLGGPEYDALVAKVKQARAKLANQRRRGNRKFLTRTARKERNAKNLGTRKNQQAQNKSQKNEKRSVQKLNHLVV